MLLYLRHILVISLLVTNYGHVHDKQTKPSCFFAMFSLFLPKTDYPPKMLFFYSVFRSGFWAPQTSFTDWTQRQIKTNWTSRTHPWVSTCNAAKDAVDAVSFSLICGTCQRAFLLDRLFVYTEHVLLMGVISGMVNRASDFYYILWRNKVPLLKRNVDEYCFTQRKELVKNVYIR